MKVFAKDGAELFSGYARVNGEGRLESTIIMKESLEFELPAIAASFDRDHEGLMLHLDIPGSGLDTLNVLLQPEDMKALKDIPGKGLVGFVFKALR